MLFLSKDDFLLNKHYILFSKYDKFLNESILPSEISFLWSLIFFLDGTFAEIDELKASGWLLSLDITSEIKMLPS